MSSRGHFKLGTGGEVMIIRTVLRASVIAVVAVAAMGTAFAANDPPPNDDLADAQPITGLPVTFEGTFKGATKEDGSAFKDKGVWYRWTAPRAAHLSFALDTRFKGKVALFHGSPEALTEIPLTKTRDHVDRGVSYWGTRQAVVAGTEYFIAVGDGSGDFKVALDGAVPGAEIRARQAANPFDLRIPVKLSSDAPATVRLSGEIFVRPHQDKLEELWRLAPQKAHVDSDDWTSVKMRLPRKHRERGCKAILYALTLRDVRSRNAAGKATFTTAAGDRSVITWYALLDELSADDRPSIRDGDGRC